MAYTAEFADGSGIAHCSLGAIDKVSMGKRSLKVAMKDAIMKLAGITNIPQWNDAKERNLDEVRETFLMAAKKLRNRE